MDSLTAQDLQVTLTSVFRGHVGSWSVHDKKPTNYKDFGSIVKDRESFLFPASSRTQWRLCPELLSERGTQHSVLLNMWKCVKEKVSGLRLMWKTEVTLVLVSSSRFQRRCPERFCRRVQMSLWMCCEKLKARDLCGGINTLNPASPKCSGNVCEWKSVILPPSSELICPVMFL